MSALAGRNFCFASANKRLWHVAATNPVKRSSTPICATRYAAVGSTCALTNNVKSFTSSSPSNNKQNFDSIAVAGLGLMGHGICQVASTAGIHSTVIAYEQQQQFLDKGRDRINASLAKLVAKNKLTEENVSDIQGRIHYTTNVEDLANVDMVVEAVIENMDLKKELYGDLGRVCKKEAIFASNTSSLSITEMAITSGRPAQFVGVHFFNPVQIMKLVEVIRTQHTDPTVFDQAYHWVQQINKVPVSCGDTPGFIVNRLLVPSLIQAMLMIDRKDASVKDVDVSMQLGAGHPMGPLHLADYIGLDTCYFIIQGWVENFPEEPAFVMPACLKAKVDAGRLGRKAGKGFYHWDGDKRGNVVDEV